MRAFLTRSMFYLMLLAVIFLTGESLIRRIPNDYKLKVDYYTRHGAAIRTLILGNSYGYYDFDPRYFASAFNGAQIAQTLDLDAAILAQYSVFCPNLRQLIIPISDQSFYFKMSASPDSWRMKNYCIYYHLDTDFRLSDNAEMLSLPFSINRNRIISYYLRHESSLTSNALGFGTDYRSSVKKDLVATGQFATLRDQAPDSDGLPGQLAALQEIIKTCVAGNIQILLVIPPVSKPYYAVMPPAQINRAIGICDSLQKRYSQVRFLNYRQDSSYTPDLFYDADHLNEKGAAKLSANLSAILEK